MTKPNLPTTLPRIKTPNNYRALAKQRGFYWLGPIVPNTNTKTRWKCSLGHQWDATYNSIQQGKGCRACYGTLPKTADDYRAVAKQRGFRWLGPKVSNTRTKTGWQCSQGHTWQAPYESIRRGKGCPTCSHHLIKTPADYRALAKARGLRWLGPEVPDTSTSTTWQCGHQHKWEAPYHTIQRGHSCPVCGGTAPKTSDDYRALAQQQGIRWLGPEVPDTLTKTSWQCPLGHEWTSSYSTVRNGRGCPICSGRFPPSPADYHRLAKQRGFRWLGPEVPNATIKTGWQCASAHHWQVAYVSLQQGHGCPVCGHRTRARRPSDYHALAKQHGFLWLGPEVPDTGKKTMWQCPQGHHWATPFHTIQEGKGCPVCAHHIPKTSDDYRALAHARGFRWLGSDLPANTATKTQWMCSLGHVWTTRYNGIQQGHGCPVCSGGRKTPDHYRQLALECNLKWIGPEVPNVRTTTGWRCLRGHQWEATYNQIESGCRCPICIRKAQRVRLKSSK